MAEKRFPPFLKQGKRSGNTSTRTLADVAARCEFMICGVATLPAASPDAVLRGPRVGLSVAERDKPPIDPAGASSPIETLDGLQLMALRAR